MEEVLKLLELSEHAILIIVLALGCLKALSSAASSLIPAVRKSAAAQDLADRIEALATFAGSVFLLVLLALLSDGGLATALWVIGVLVALLGIYTLFKKFAEKHQNTLAAVTNNGTSLNN
jgi:hypothetical protein